MEMPSLPPRELRYSYLLDGAIVHLVLENEIIWCLEFATALKLFSKPCVERGKIAEKTRQKPPLTPTGDSHILPAS